MGLNETPSSDRIHIGIFGRRNAGKSSVINAITGQNLAIVSETEGTTTDPVKKAMELLPLGPVLMIDTPGLDDEGELGKKRVEKSYQMLNQTDIVLLVLDGTAGVGTVEQEILALVKEKKLPYIIAVNKSDEFSREQRDAVCQKLVGEDNLLFVSAKTKRGIRELKEALAGRAPQPTEKRIVADLISEGDSVVLVVPIDKAAPKGRLILPQQQTIRDILDKRAVSVVTQEDRVEEVIRNMKVPPALVVTDSQAFATVASQTPDYIPLTSFSILFARYKGELQQQVQGARTLDTLKDGDIVLISEGCTHHRQCDDIGTVKLPKWISDYTKKKIQFEFTSGGEFPEKLRKYSLIVHCGACMLNEKEIKYRIEKAVKEGIPITNYGVCIAQIQGILDRSIRMFY